MFLDETNNTTTGQGICHFIYFSAVWWCLARVIWLNRLISLNNSWLVFDSTNTGRAFGRVLYTIYHQVSSFIFCCVVCFVVAFDLVICWVHLVISVPLWWLSVHDSVPPSGFLTHDGGTTGCDVLLIIRGGAMICIPTSTSFGDNNTK